MSQGTEEITEQPETGEADVADKLAALQAQLDEERKAKAELQAEGEAWRAQRNSLEATLAGKDARIAELQAERDEAAGKYLSMARALNPAIPEMLITGSTITEIEASVQKGKETVEAVKSAIAAAAAASTVPAGAPAREGIPGVESMSAREKIAYGTKTKGGAS